jgi:hypothetical protein
MERARGGGAVLRLERRGNRTATTTLGHGDRWLLAAATYGPPPAASQLPREETVELLSDEALVQVAVGCPLYEADPTGRGYFLGGARA